MIVNLYARKSIPSFQSYSYRYVSVVSQWERIYSFSPSIQSDSAIDVCDALRGPSKHIPAEIETAREEWRPSMAEWAAFVEPSPRLRRPPAACLQHRWRPALIAMNFL